MTATTATGESEWVEKLYAPSDACVVNPERGLYVGIGDRRQQPLRPKRLEGLRDRGITLVQRLYYLKGYRDCDLDAAQLDLIRRDFEALQEAGMKAILRFAYSSRIGEPDAPLPVVLRHIEQLKPLLRENADLILTLQAGFIGAWGEWHASTNGLTEPEAMKRVALALLEALPSDLTIQVRTPRQKQLVVGSVEPLRAHRLDRINVSARIGHHNDCFLADETDVGTYRRRQLEEERAYVASDSLFVPMGGETCRLTSRSNPDFARSELQRMHWSFLNLAYHRGVIAKWRDTGFLDEVRERLGYRLRLVSAKFRVAGPACDRLEGELAVANDGWAAPIRSRKLHLILRNEETRAEAKLAIDVDVRNWAPGEVTVVRFAKQLPLDLPEDVYCTFLLLPDPSERLADDERYDVRLANLPSAADGRAAHRLNITVSTLKR